MTRPGDALVDAIAEAVALKLERMNAASQRLMEIEDAARYLGHLDEVFIRTNGRQHYLWRAVDQDGDVLDILVQPRRDRRAAERFFRKLLRSQGGAPFRIITDKLRSYSAAVRSTLREVSHTTERYANNRVEVSHQGSRERERHMRHFKSAGQPQRFLSLHAVVHNLFRMGRHLLRAVNYRLLRSRSFSIWQSVTEG